MNYTYATHCLNQGITLDLRTEALQEVLQEAQMHPKEKDNITAATNKCNEIAKSLKETQTKELALPRIKQALNILSNFMPIQSELQTEEQQMLLAAYHRLAVSTYHFIKHS